MRINPFKMFADRWAPADPKSKKYAYEVAMVNPNNFTYDDLKYTEIRKFVHQGEDLKRKQFFGISAETIIISEEIPENRSKSGMEAIIDIIEGQNVPNTYDNSVFEGDENAGVSGSIRLRYDVKLDDYTKECEGIIRIYIAENVTIDGKPYSADEIMRCYPLDPATHLRYPARWFQAKMFFPVGLFAPSMIGKTTAMVSMFASEKNAYWPSEWQITSAMEQNDVIQIDFKKKIKALVDERKCPDYTQTELQVPPVFYKCFIKIDDKEEEAIIGIYDFSGEALSNRATGNELVKLFPLMRGIIFMVSPSVVPGYVAKSDLNNAESISESRLEAPIEILSLKKQAEFQKKHHGETLNGRENPALSGHKNTIKDNSSGSNDESGINAMHETMRQLMDNPHRLKYTHLAFVISQCDRLEGQDCVSGEYTHLFTHDSERMSLYNKGRENVDWFEQIQALEADFIKKKVLNSAVTDMLEKANNDHVSYHVVSATGCGTIDPVNAQEQKYGTLIKPLDPIRIREPLIVCVNEMTTNGFYYKDEKE